MKKNKKVKSQEKDKQKNKQKVAAGLAALHSQEQLAAISEGTVSHNEAQKIAKRVKRSFPIFKSLSAIEGGNTWNYQYVVSRQVEKGQKPKAKGEDEIVQIASFGKRPGFSSTVKNEITIDQGQHRRHIIAYEILHERLKIAVNGKTVAKAAKMLRIVKYPPREMSVNGIKDAGRKYLIDRNNDQDNLWAGDGPENSSLGSRMKNAKMKLEAALESGDLQAFNAGIKELTATAVDPDPSNLSKVKYSGTYNALISSYRAKFRAIHGFGPPR